MQDRGQVIRQLVDIISSRFGVDASTIGENTSQRELGIDSILLVDLMMDLEEAFGVEFKNIDLPPNPTVGQIADFVMSSPRTSAQS